jgi:hypothetical protein
MSVAH